ncbi:nucleoside/nucleotide kinase family protein [Pararhodobacter zhoushanensis]|uniref:nucleoside/nucleotide kinase family protein n=1 Tax=Pararhodobacter zhoushanensis TaxID=2479545 RepID=UPI000F8F4A3E|nr:nucleoside/nucleotide kinase family protein [Pararhodobacter zhoushanensis]
MAVLAPDALAALIDARQAASGGRLIVALAGAPASGKSTLVDDLAQELGTRAAVLPMDGYHLDNAVLEARGHRDRKGAPWTFDVGGLARDLARVRADDAPVLVPVFDRALDLSRGSAREITPDVRIVLVEGNYLLLNDPPWAALAGFWDLTVMLDVPLSVLEARLIQRWEGRAAAADWIRLNDLPNARIVIERSRPADVVIGG